MKIILQRVNQASVKVNNQVIGEIGIGYLLLVAVQNSDTEKEVEYLVNKVNNLRLFEDELSKMNLNIHDVGGSILSVSQFTLYADTHKGNRPSFKNAGEYDFSLKMYNMFNEKLLEKGLQVATGSFGADMQVQLENNGPATLILDTDNK